MKQNHVLTVTALLLAGCASEPRAAPVLAPAAPQPVQTVQTENPAPPPPSVPAGWEDQPATPGDWRYVAGPAATAEYGEATGPRFTIRCDLAQARIFLSRSDGAGPLTIRTTSLTRTLEAADGALAASDPFLDAITFSRGRFAVEAPGQPALIVPPWPEVARVVEECRP